MRGRLFSAIAVAPLLGGAAPAAAAPSASAVVPAVQTRKIVDLADGWRFRFGEQAEAVTRAGFDDSAWQPVALPHSWNRIGAYALRRPYPGRNNDQGTGWYRRSFEVAARAPGRRLYLQFEGVGAVAQVWVNGTPVGGHKGAFSRFRFDVTDAVRPGTNLLVVSADNSKPKPGSPTGDVLPLAGDFFIYGGIYRGVSLIEAADAQIDLLDHGGPGVYARTEQADAASARIAITTRLRNAGGRPRRLAVVTTLVDAGGRTVASATGAASLGARATADVAQVLAVSSPHLWAGTADPYLYRLVGELRDGVRVIDRVEQPFGIRTMHVDADKGFFLNGKPLPLHGISRHQDMLGKGWALTAGDHAADMAIVKEIGANTVRLAHYQHAQEWVDEADRAGMVTWGEVPFVTASNLQGKAPTPALVANAREQLIELIRQNYNHPSIAMWSVGNEVNAGELFLPGKLPQQSAGLLKELNDLAKAEDSGRATSFADCCEDSADFKVRGPALAGTTDLIGYNRYYGWYYGKPGDFGPELDKLHAKHPALPMSVSEYGAGGALSQHSDNPEGGAIAIVGRPHPEEYQSWYHERSWKQLAARRYLYANWIWALFDFASDMRGEGESVDMNDKGLVTFDRKVKKDAFYLYKANWSDQPVLHLTGRRYTDRAYPVADVRAYSNAERASLTLNGAAVGEVACPDRICVWKAVRLRPGANRIEARATIGGKTLSDAIDWTAPDTAAGLHIEAGELNGRMSGDVRYGSDNFFIGGTPVALNPPILRADGPMVPGKKVTGSGDLLLHKTFRQGDFSYDLPLPDGKWTVTLHMVEPDPALAATRSFDVTASGKRVLKDFSPARTAGGPLIAVTHRFTARAAGGHLRIDFKGKGGPALVSALDIAKGEDR